jgi:hypothetical protein
VEQPLHYHLLSREHQVLCVCVCVCVCLRPNTQVA